MKKENFTYFANMNFECIQDSTCFSVHNVSILLENYSFRKPLFQEKL